MTRYCHIMIRIFFTYLIIFGLNLSSYGQDFTSLAFYEDTLKKLGKAILYGEHDIDKYAANEKFQKLLEESLYLKNAYEFPFDSVKTLSKLSSEDKQLRIFTWNLPKKDGTYHYFGFLMSLNKAKKRYFIYKLDDKSELMENAEIKTLEPEKWYGALYYKLIQTQDNNKRYYTLLGWDGNNTLTNRKIIEILTVSQTGEPKFGQPIFKCEKKKLRRYFFEYAKDASMSLKYEPQKYEQITREKKVVDKKGKQSRKKIDFNALQKEKILAEKSKMKLVSMIVFDRLSPLDPNLEGMYQYYVPETNIYDAFIFENGKWVLVKDTDARNPAPPKSKTEIKKPINYDLFPKKQ